VVSGQYPVSAQGINADETLTITLGGESFDVQLLSGDTLADIVTRINQAAESAEVQVQAFDAGGTLSLRSRAYGSDQVLEAVSTRPAQADGSSSGIGTTTLSDTGVDVIGQIDGVDAEGSGNVLKGAEGTDAEGLSVQIFATTASISAKGGDFGTVSFVRGLAELFEESLDDLTDPFAGTLESVTSGIDRNIERMEETIERLEARLLHREELLVRQFSAVEAAVAALQQQQHLLG
jgi:flagellar hook-associated protein 2